MSDPGRDQVTIEVRPYERSLVKKASGFSSGQPELDDWLRNQAGQQERRDNTRTFVAVPKGTDQVVGYYATTTYRIEPDETSVDLGAGHRRYPLPAVLLARLAIDRHWQGAGIGRQLLIDALQRIAEASRSVGFEVVVVDAIDDSAVTFYARYGFRQFEGHPRKLYLTTRQLVATLEAASSAPR